MSSSPAKSRVLIVTPDVLGARMAGPAIRAYEMAKALADTARVHLVSTVECSLEESSFPIEFADEDRLKVLVDEHEVLVFQGHVLSSFPWITKTNIIVVADIYDPMQLEILEQGKDLRADLRLEQTLNTVEVLNLQIERADFMICASEKQRDLWLGQLGALGRINPLTYDFDPSLRSLIDVAPFGIQSTPPSRSAPGIKGVLPGIEPSDKVIIWGGGIYNWFDPLTLIRAIAQMALTHPDLRLFFLGLQHPNPHVPAMKMATAAMELADELNLTGRHVFFNTEWVAYEQRANYLLDADLGVSTHFEHVETAFSFRTRILDYLWSGLPIISTDGDTFAPLIRDHGLGQVVAPESVDELAQAIEQVLYDSEAQAIYKQNVLEFRNEMTWEKALSRLVRFCESPQHAADYREGIIPPREAYYEQLRQRVEALEGSTTWRLAAPVRWFTSLLRAKR